jgi:hypothetical protein
MKNNLNEEIQRIRSLIYEHDTTKKNSSTRNEDFISLYEKFNITFDNKTISVLNEQGLIKKVKEGLSELGRKIRGMVQNKWAKKQKLPTKNELMENDKKNSPAIVTHPAYKDTIELMYRKKIRNATAILYWYYGEGFVLGDEEIGDKASAQRGLDLLNQIYNNVESYKNTDFQKFISEPIELKILYSDRALTWFQINDIIIGIAAMPQLNDEVKTYLKKLQTDGNSVGGKVSVTVTNLPAGLGEPAFDKLKADLAKAMLSLPACNGFSIGEGFKFADHLGSQISSHSEFFGGMEGGISNGEEIHFNLVFKAPSTIGEKAKNGRHDPCVLPRVIPIVEAMTKIVIADHFLRQSAYDSFLP